MKNLILIGGGGHCKSCIDVIEQEGKYQIKGIVDIKEKLGEKILGYKIIGTDNEIEELAKNNTFIITLGQLKSPDKRIELFEKLVSLNVNIPVIISPFAYISKYSSIGKGTIIFHHALVNADVKIGDNCIINTKALVEHDSVIGDHCHISTSALVNGGSKVGAGTFIGSNAVSKEYITIPEKSFIKAGSLYK